YHKLLVIPLLIAQFRTSERGWWVIFGFFGSMMVVLALSWSQALLPDLSWRGRILAGTPAKDYICQSGTFALCPFAALAYALWLWRDGRREVALMLIATAALLLADIFYVAAGRTTLVV